MLTSSPTLLNSQLPALESPSSSSPSSSPDHSPLLLALHSPDHTINGATSRLESFQLSIDDLGTACTQINPGLIPTTSFLLDPYHRTAMNSMNSKPSSRRRSRDRHTAPAPSSNTTMANHDTPSRVPRQYTQSSPCYNNTHSSDPVILSRFDNGEEGEEGEDHSFIGVGRGRRVTGASSYICDAVPGEGGATHRQYKQHNKKYSIPKQSSRAKQLPDSFASALQKKKYQHPTHPSMHPSLLHPVHHSANHSVNQKQKSSSESPDWSGHVPVGPVPSMADGSSGIRQQRPNSYLNNVHAISSPSSSSSSDCSSGSYNASQGYSLNSSHSNHLHQPSSLFPPIVAAQFDPVYSLPLLPDSSLFETRF